VHPEANIIFGAVIDDTLGDEVRVTVIAAGFDGGEPVRAKEARRTNYVAAGTGTQAATATATVEAPTTTAWTDEQEAVVPVVGRGFDDEGDDLDIPEFLR
jgi:cell division protein FtsZ